MYSGLHAMNNAVPESREDPRMVVLNAARPYAVKLLHIDGCEHRPDNLAILRGAGVSEFVVRLPDFRPEHPDPFAYARRCVPVIVSFYNVGVRRFQVDNEPNWNWRRMPMGPWQYQWYMHLVASTIRRAVPSDVRLVSPPLSYSPGLWRLPNKWSDFTLDMWRAAFKGPREGPSLYSRFDEAGATVYWGDEDQLEDPSYGDSYRAVHADSGLPVLVVEYAKDFSEVPPEVLEYQRFREYPRWLRRARSSTVVVGAFAYIWYGTADWERFFLTPKIAMALGKWRLTIGLGQGRYPI